jgi:hypothetical protein
MSNQEKLSKIEREELGVDVNRVLEEQLPPAITRDMVKEATEKILQMVLVDMAKGLCRKGLIREDL